MKLMIKGFNAYKKGLVDFAGKKYVLGELYHSDELVYGKKGFFFYRDLENTLAFYDGLHEELDIAEVEGYDETCEYLDSYTEARIVGATDFRIARIMPREEIINYALHLNEISVGKFLAGYRLTEEEMARFDKMGEIVKLYVDYHQRGDKEVFERKYGGNAKRIGTITRKPRKG